MWLFPLIKYHFVKFLPLVFLGIIFLVPLAACAEEIENTEGRGKVEENDQDFVDLYHSYFTEKIRGPTIWFDSFFGDPRTDEEDLPTSFVRLRLQAHYTEGDGFAFPLRLRAINLQKLLVKVSPIT